MSAACIDLLRRRLVLAVVLAGAASGLVLGSPQAGEPPAAAAERVDQFGDPLPAGALARLGTVRMRHGYAKWAVPLPDGKTVITFGGGPTARVWDLATGRLVREFGPFPSSVGRPALSPDGRWLVVASPEASRVWDVSAGRLAYTAADDGWLPVAYAFSPDSRLLASYSCDVNVRFRDVATGRLLHVSDRLKVDLKALVFADADTLLSGDNRGMVKVWDVATAKVRREFKGGKDSIAMLALAPGGKLLATACDGEKMVRVFEMPAGKEVAAFDTGESVYYTWPLAFSPDGKTLAAGGFGEGVIRLWDVATRQVRPLPFGREVPGGKRAGGLSTVAFSLDGRWLLGPDAFHVVRCIDVATGRDRFASDHHAGPIRGLAFSADGQAIRTGCMDTWVRTYDRGGRLLRRDPAGHTTMFAPDGRVALTWWGDEWWFVDPDTGRTWGRTKAGRYGPEGAAFAPDGRTVAVLSIPPGQPPGPLRAELLLHDVATGQRLRTFDDPVGRNVLKFTPDGRTLAQVGQRGDEHAQTVRLWDVATGRTKGRMPVAEGWVSRDASFSPDGRLIAVPLLEGPASREVGQGPIFRSPWVSILELATGHERLRLRLEPSERVNEIWSVRFAPDGRRLLLGLDDGTVRLWDLAAGQEQARFAGNAGSVTALAVSPDGRQFAAGHGSQRDGGSGEGVAHLWPLPPARERPVVALPTDRGERDALWAELGSADATQAGRTIGRLAADPAGATAFIRERLTPVAAPDADHLRRLIEDLDSPRFATRMKAVAELERLHDQAGEVLRQALTKNPSAEVRTQVERLLAKLDGLVESSSVLHAIRAVEVLETAGTADARRLLTELAKGDPNARMTRDAQSSLERLSRSEGR